MKEKTMKKIIISLVLITCIASMTILYKTTLNQQTKKALIIGTASGYAPWVSINPDGDYEGFDIDVAQALANELGELVEIKDLGSMTPLFMALDQGSIDAIIWGLSITQDRLKKVAMIHYQGELVNAYPLVLGHNTAGIKSVDDLQVKPLQ